MMKNLEDMTERELQNKLHEIRKELMAAMGNLILQEVLERYKNKVEDQIIYTLQKNKNPAPAIVDEYDNPYAPENSSYD